MPINITNNSIDKGLAANASTIYEYATHAHIYGKSNIKNNFFNGFSAAENVLKLEAACFVTDNSFKRDAVSITAYIQNIGSTNQSISENSFDKITVDGTSEELVSGLTNNSYYDRNQNQICYKTFFIPIFAASAANASKITNTGNGAYQDVSITGMSAASHVFTSRFNLSNVLPNKTKMMNITLASLGSSGTTGFDTAGTATFSLYIDKTISQKINFASAPTNFANTIVDIANNLITGGTEGSLSEYIEIVLDTPTKYTNWTTITQYAYFSPEDTTDEWIIDKERDILLQQFVTILFSGGGTTAGFRQCILVRYKYL